MAVWYRSRYVVSACVSGGDSDGAFVIHPPTRSSVRVQSRLTPDAFVGSGRVHCIFAYLHVWRLYIEEYSIRSSRLAAFPRFAVSVMTGATKQAVSYLSGDGEVPDGLKRGKG